MSAARRERGAGGREAGGVIEWFMKYGKKKKACPEAAKAFLSPAGTLRTAGRGSEQSRRSSGIPARIAAVSLRLTRCPAALIPSGNIKKQGGRGEASADLSPGTSAKLLDGRRCPLQSMSLTDAKDREPAAPRHERRALARGEPGLPQGVSLSAPEHKKAPPKGRPVFAARSSSLQSQQSSQSSRQV